MLCTESYLCFLSQDTVLDVKSIIFAPLDFNYARKVSFTHKESFQVISKQWRGAFRQHD